MRILWSHFLNPIITEFFLYNVCSETKTRMILLNQLVDISKLISKSCGFQVMISLIINYFSATFMIFVAFLAIFENSVEMQELVGIFVNNFLYDYSVIVLICILNSYLKIEVRTSEETSATLFIFLKIFQAQNILNKARKIKHSQSGDEISLTCGIVDFGWNILTSVN